MKIQANLDINLPALLEMLSSHLYKSEFVFTRELIQNAIDALRMIELDENRYSETEETPKILVYFTENNNKLVFEDFGIGMNISEIQEFYWTIGGSNKRKPEMIKCNVLGKFGIGNLSSFGISKSVEVTTWKSKYEQITCKILKNELLKNNRNFEISSSSELNHYGSRITIEFEKIIKPADIEKYIKKVVGYISEPIFLNNELISTKEFDAINTLEYEIFSEKSIDIFNTIEKKDIKQLAQIFYNPEKESLMIIIDYKVDNFFFKAEFSPHPLNQLRVYLNNYLISENIPLSNTMLYKGYINTNIWKPDMSRDYLEETSNSAYTKFLSQLNLFLCETLYNKMLLSKFSYIMSFVVEQSKRSIAYSKFVNQLKIKVYGLEELITLQKLIDDSKKFKKEVYISQHKEIPENIISLAVKQDVYVVQIQDLSLNYRVRISEILKASVAAKEISAFQLEYKVVNEEMISEEMKFFKEGFIEALKSIYFIRNFEIFLCYSKPNNTIIFNKDKSIINIYINIQTSLFLDCLKYVRLYNFRFLLNNVYIIPYLADVLKNYIPKNFNSIDEFNSEKVNLDEITDILLNKAQAGSNYEGPEQNCIRVVSQDFEHLNGYYVKIPKLISKELDYALNYNTPIIYWSDNILYFNFFHKNNMISLKLQVIDSIEDVNGINFGVAKETRNTLIFRSGIYVPIPFPKFKDVLPFNSTKELEFSFKIHQEMTKAKFIKILSFDN